MPHITYELLRKRSEHNEGIISTMEELSLHQEELEKIDAILGTTCQKLKILYLQNNIIGRMENLHHLKQLEYLNLALNNITVIEGLGSCEFLKKLDLTVNFIDLDHFENSISHLSPLQNLQELYLIGNPCQAKWERGYQLYIIGKLPQLQYLDGKGIVKSQRIQAAQQLPHLEEELKQLAVESTREKIEEELAQEKAVKLVNDGEILAKPEVEEESKPSEELTAHTPEVRTQIYREMAEQKAEKEARQKEMLPRERNYEQEQLDAVQRIREKEEEGKTRQCNEGKWDFFFDEESKPGFILLEVCLPKHLNSSLIDIDCHPTYISIVIKSKVIRLNLPAEVRSEESTAQRSKTTGHLVIKMPKFDSKAKLLTYRRPEKSNHSDNKQRSGNKRASATQSSKMSLAQLMIQTGLEARSNTNI